MATRNGVRFAPEGEGNNGKWEFFQPKQWIDKTDREFSVHWAFKLDHLHPFKPLLFPKFSNFFSFILGGPFLLPQRANDGRREFTQLKVVEVEGIIACGNQTIIF